MKNTRPIPDDPPSDPIEQLAHDVAFVFDQLCEKREPAVLLFQEAYDKRSRQSGFREANRFFGLTGVLTDLFREAPSEKYYKRVHSSVEGQIQPRFVHSVRNAIREIAQKNRYAFETMNEHLASSSKGLNDLLPALFRFYAENEEVLPC